MVEPCYGELLADYYTPDRAAHAIGLTRRTLDAMYARREGPPRTKIGGRIYYRKKSLQQWLLEQEQHPVRGRAGVREPAMPRRTSTMTIRRTQPPPEPADRGACTSRGALIAVPPCPSPEPQYTHCLAPVVRVLPHDPHFIVLQASRLLPSRLHRERVTSCDTRF